MKITVYKVVTKFEGEYYSCRTCGDSAEELKMKLQLPDHSQILKYAVDKTTVPNFGYIFAFDSMFAADGFIEQFQRIMSEPLKLCIIVGIGDVVDDRDEYRDIVNHRLVACTTEVSKMISAWELASGIISVDIPTSTLFLRSFFGTRLIDPI